MFFATLGADLCTSSMLLALMSLLKILHLTKHFFKSYYAIGFELKFASITNGRCFPQFYKVFSSFYSTLCSGVCVLLRRVSKPWIFRI